MLDDGLVVGEDRARQCEATALLIDGGKKLLEFFISIHVGEEYRAKDLLIGEMVVDVLRDVD